MSLTGQVRYLIAYRKLQLFCCGIGALSIKESCSQAQSQNSTVYISRQKFKQKYRQFVLKNFLIILPTLSIRGVAIALSSVPMQY